MTSKKRSHRAASRTLNSPPVRRDGSRSTSIPPTRTPAVRVTRKPRLSRSRSIHGNVDRRGRAAASIRLLVTTAAVACGAASPAGAHGFGQRYELPLPLSLYLFGTAAAVVLSFVVVGLFVRRAPRSLAYPHVDLRDYPLGRLIAYPGVALSLR